MRGLLVLLSRSERRDEAQALIAEFRQKNPKEANRFNENQASLLRDEAKTFVSARRPSHALLALETAVLLAPLDAWIRHDLAILYESLGLQTLGRRVMAEGAALAPDNSGMNYAYAMVLTAQDREEESLQRLARIPPSARSSAMNELDQVAYPSRLKAPSWRQERRSSPDAAPCRTTCCGQAEFDRASVGRLV
jgi:Flp pilus assembly protein TadD